MSLVTDNLCLELKGTPDQYRNGIKYAIERGWIVMHEGEIHLKFTQARTSLPDRKRRGGFTEPGFWSQISYSFLCTHGLGGVSLKHIFVSPPRVLH